MADKTSLTFAISLSVLNHLGRNLYRSFATVLGEAVSNSWDADAGTVRIDVDREKGSLVISDDGNGMSAKDIQEKFLRIGYSKRKAGLHRTRRGRPFIGRKGIGKLALLSCAKRITVVSKRKGGRLAGGVIDNAELDEAIVDDLQPHDYVLQKYDPKALEKYTKSLKQGTIIHFDAINEGVRNSVEHLRKMIALYFRFSLVDPSFKILLNGERVTFKDLGQLADNTEFLWKVGKVRDPFVSDLEKQFRKSPHDHEVGRIAFPHVSGFVASVKKPTHLKIMATDERVGIDLFVNGRLRERDILKHIPTAQVVESYLFGQIHFDGLDDKEDRFTSSREGVVANDPKFEKFLKKFRKVLLRIANEWDQWRRQHREEGDAENPAVSKKQRASDNLYNAIVDEFGGASSGTKRGREVDDWFEELSTDASYNFQSYAECFVSENMIRKLIRKKAIALSPEAKAEIERCRKMETESKSRGNISIDIRGPDAELSYLDMKNLANLVDKNSAGGACLARDAQEFKPMRDAVAHTARITDAAKERLSAVRENIKARVNTLLQ